VKGGHWVRVILLKPLGDYQRGDLVEMPCAVAEVLELGEFVIGEEQAMLTGIPGAPGPSGVIQG
jgi:hypothetical protein